MSFRIQLCLLMEKNIKQSDGSETLIQHVADYKRGRVGDRKQAKWFSLKKIFSIFFILHIFLVSFNWSI